MDTFLQKHLLAVGWYCDLAAAEELHDLDVARAAFRWLREYICIKP